MRSVIKAEGSLLRKASVQCIQIRHSISRAVLPQQAKAAKLAVAGQFVAVARWGPGFDSQPCQGSVWPAHMKWQNWFAALRVRGELSRGWCDRCIHRASESRSQARRCGLEKAYRSQHRRILTGPPRLSAVLTTISFVVSWFAAPTVTMPNAPPQTSTYQMRSRRRGSPPHLTCHLKPSHLWRVQQRSPLRLLSPKRKRRPKKTKNNKGGKPESNSGNAEERPPSPSAGASENAGPKLYNKKHNYRHQYTRVPTTHPMRSTTCIVLWEQQWCNNWPLPPTWPLTLLIMDWPVRTKNNPLLLNKTY